MSDYRRPTERPRGSVQWKHQPQRDHPEPEPSWLWLAIAYCAVGFGLGVLLSLVIG